MTTLAVVLADESKKSGPIGLAVILVLCVLCYFLFKSMSKHLRRVREDFPTTPAPSPTADGGPAGDRGEPPAGLAQSEAAPRPEDREAGPPE